MTNMVAELCLGFNPSKCVLDISLKAHFSDLNEKELFGVRSYLGLKLLNNLYCSETSLDTVKYGDEQDIL